MYQAAAAVIAVVLLLVFTGHLPSNPLLIGRDAKSLMRVAARKARDEAEAIAETEKIENVVETVAETLGLKSPKAEAAVSNTPPTITPPAPSPPPPPSEPSPSVAASVPPA